MSDDALRYPIGKFQSKGSYSSEEIAANIRLIESLPTELEQLIRPFPASRFDTPYRNGGWSARQVIHHMADSHMNAYIRCKWTLTENSPTIKAYDEKLWAETPEANADPSLSVALLKALHAKWTILLKSLSAEQLQKDFTHPETGKKIRLDTLMALYAWHGQHHLGHLRIISKA